MKLYLAGPMTGIAEHNYPAFHAAAARLRALGHDVINPADVNPDTQILGADAPPVELWRYCMRRDIPHLLTCEAVVVLPNWEKSKGARLEVFIAHQLGMPILLLDNLQPITGGKIALIKEFLAFPS